MTVEEADAALEAAIRDVASARGFLEPDEFVGDWVVVLETPSIEDAERSPYVVLLPNGLLAAHRIVGLLELAKTDRTGPGADL